MKTSQQRWTAETGWMSVAAGTAIHDAQLVLVFGARERLRDSARGDELREMYPRAELFATALQFEETPIKVASTPIAHEDDSEAAGHRLAAQLPPEGLSHVGDDALRAIGR